MDANIVASRIFSLVKNLQNSDLGVKRIELESRGSTYITRISELKSTVLNSRSSKLTQAVYSYCCATSLVRFTLNLGSSSLDSSSSRSLDCVAVVSLLGILGDLPIRVE